MKTVQLVTGVKITEVPLLGRDEIPYHGNLKNTRCVYEKKGVEKFLALDGIQDIQYARVMHFRESDKPDIYTAWSEETEQALGIPLRVILKEKGLLEHKLGILEGNEVTFLNNQSEYIDEILSYENMSFWQRLKWVFKGG